MQFFQCHDNLTVFVLFWSFKMCTRCFCKLNYNRICISSKFTSKIYFDKDGQSPPPGFSGGHAARYSVLCVVYYRSLIVLFFLLVIVLSVILRFAASDYPFGIFNLFREPTIAFGITRLLGTLIFRLMVCLIFWFKNAAHPGVC